MIMTTSGQEIWSADARGCLSTSSSLLTLYADLGAGQSPSWRRKLDSFNGGWGRPFAIKQKGDGRVVAEPIWSS
jgi:hypothetical protein